jgi:3-methyladenine DNA glycosylase AlkD
MELRKKVKEDIKEMADEKYRNFQSGLCPGTENIMGVRIPHLREYSKKMNKEYTLKQILEEVEDEYYEETMLKGISIGLNKKEDIDKILKYIEQFVPKIDNWASIKNLFFPCAGKYYGSSFDWVCYLEFYTEIFKIRERI